MTLTRLMRLLTLLAMLMAPLGMMSSHAAMAMPTATATEHAAPPASHHCDPAPTEEDGASKPSIDCTIFCSAMPATAALGSAQQALAGLPQLPAIEIDRRGLSPESDPPPPRLS